MQPSHPTAKQATGSEQSSELPLAGLRIVDLSAVQAGPFATSFLAAFGAEVIKIEPPGGDITRQVGHSPRPQMPATFQHINGGKKSMVLDLKNPSDMRQLHALIATADALVSNLRPDAMNRLGLSKEAVQAIKPSVIYCSLTGFGSEGRYAGMAAYDDLIQGMAGIPELMGRTTGDGIPRYVPFALADRVVGLYTAIGLLIALLGVARGKSATPAPAVEVPMFESMTHFILVEHLYYKSFDPPIGPEISPRSTDSSRKPFKTQDGFICVLPYSDKNWQDLFTAAGASHLFEDGRYNNFASRMGNARFLHDFIADFVENKSTDECLRLFKSLSIAATPMRTISELMDDGHLKDVQFFRREPETDGTSFISLATPIKLDNIKSEKVLRAPMLGEHNA